MRRIAAAAVVVLLAVGCAPRERQADTIRGATTCVSESQRVELCHNTITGECWRQGRNRGFGGDSSGESRPVAVCDRAGLT